MSETARNGIELPILIIDRVRYDITKLIDRELSDLKTKVDMSIAQLEHDISEAKMTAQATGEYASPSWYAGINRIKRIRGQQSQCIQTELGARSRIVKQKNNKTLASCFMEVARQTLSKEGFSMIMEAAQAMAEEKIS